MSIDSATYARGGLHPRMASFDLRQPSFDLPRPPPQELPSDEL